MRIENKELVVDAQAPFLILQLGVGGTGGNTLLSLAKVLRGFQVAKEEIHCRYVIADGAMVKEHNLENQNFLPKDVGRKKVQVLSERYSRQLGLNIYHHNDYVESLESLQSLVKGLATGHQEVLILLGCVDNNRSRQVLHRFFLAYEGNLIYVDAGNDKTSGQVVLGARTKDELLLPPVCVHYPDMLEDEDRFKSEESCQANYVRYPQLQVTNEKAADAMVNMVHNLLRFRKSQVCRITFSIETMSQRAMYISELREKNSRDNFEEL